MENFGALGFLPEESGNFHFTAYLLDLAWCFIPEDEILFAEVLSVDKAFYSEVADKADKAKAIQGHEKLKSLVERLERRGSGKSTGTGTSGSGSEAASGDADTLGRRLLALADDEEVMSNITDEDAILEELAAALDEVRRSSEESTDPNSDANAVSLEWDDDAADMAASVLQAENRLLEVRFYGIRHPGFLGGLWVMQVVILDLTRLTD